MRNWILSSVLLLFLSACTNNNMVEEQVDDQKDEPIIEDVQDQEVNHPSSPEEEIDETEEAPEAVNGVEETSSAPQYTLREDWSIAPIDNADSKVVLLTIDDAPDRYALNMAETLDSLGVKAIFFVNGHFLDTEDEREVLREIHRLGFSIGNHTMTHKSLRDLSEEEQYEEIVGLNDLVEEIIGERPKYFRAPFGLNTDYSRELAHEEDMLLMNWTYGYDWESAYRTKEAIADIMVNAPELRDGANLLMHDREWTNEALEDIVKGLQEKGYSIVDPETIQQIDK